MNAENAEKAGRLGSIALATSERLRNEIVLEVRNQLIQAQSLRGELKHLEFGIFSLGNDGGPQ